MSSLANEYLDNLIKKKLFKDFSEWEKDDFHFLLTLLNYPNYTDLALVILSNLKNWITYSNGIFFYPIEKLQKILDKYYVQKDIFEDISTQENIKINIQKKESNPVENDDLLNVDLDSGIINIGDFLSIDTFKFLICTIVFFILLFISFSISSLYNSSDSYTNNYYPNPNKKMYNNYFNEVNDFKELFELPEKNTNSFENIINSLPKRESIIKTILKYLTRFLV